jgi:hypothetical protein
VLLPCASRVADYCIKGWLDCCSGSRKGGFVEAALSSYLVPIVSSRLPWRRLVAAYQVQEKIPDYLAFCWRENWIDPEATEFGDFTGKERGRETIGHAAGMSALLRRRRCYLIRCTLRTWF